VNGRPLHAVPVPEEWTKAFPFRDGLSQRGADLLRGAIAPKTFPAGTVLLEEGQPCEGALLVTSGSIRVYKTSPSGREITLYLVQPGEMCVLGISCLLNDTRYPARAAVKTDTEAFGIPAPAFRRLFREEAPVQRFVLDMFSSRLSSVMQLVEEVAFRRMDERLAVFLLKEAERSPGTYHPVAMSHEQIATHLGTAREVVSRLLSQLEGDGLVRLGRRRVHITSPQELRRVVGPG
jgi:CRP/FNR family transcriptional regulator